MPCRTGNNHCRLLALVSWMPFWVSCFPWWCFSWHFEDANKKPTIAGYEDAGTVDVQPVSRSSVRGVSGEDQAGGVWKREDSLRTPQPIGFL